ncbi:MAG: hypothetical protein ACKOCC_08585 [Actinomycetota bacterium]
MAVAVVDRVQEAAVPAVVEPEDADLEARDGMTTGRVDRVAMMTGRADHAGTMMVRVVASVVARDASTTTGRVDRVAMMTGLVVPVAMTTGR